MQMPNGYESRQGRKTLLSSLTGLMRNAMPVTQRSSAGLLSLDHGPRDRGFELLQLHRFHQMLGEARL